ncbi:hypothetical protein G7Y89_g9496 [Cudoniella acicularis]|uniref:Alpha-ketoglutarate-dependent dioxygenase AlkB-like domain-containing protein n=1 Tax=Cudoniella acicularis TaxID=354080 RepID=A0A8H4REJ5_9HELO|nr:hypothetical protein G7Y89_g9496 [Cudoniella acicularis]
MSSDRITRSGKRACLAAEAEILPIDTAVSPVTPKVNGSEFTSRNSRDSTPLSSPPSSIVSPFSSVRSSPSTGNKDSLIIKLGISGDKLAAVSPHRIEPLRRILAPISPSQKGQKQPAEPYHSNALQDKPAPIGKPTVWAAKRQQLCETLPYYKAYQSAAYTSEGVVYGFMCDKEVGVRDRFDDQILISRIGGGRSQDETGKMVQTKDQVKKTARVLAFEQSKELKVPVAIIAGQGNSIAPSKMPHYYNVLDYFHVTDVWADVNNGCKTWMARMEKINLYEPSWWSPQESKLRSYPDFANPEARTLNCQICGVGSKCIYNQGWACLNPECKEFFQFADGFDDSTLDYNSDFLNERTSFNGYITSHLSPPLLTEEDLTAMHAYGIEEVFKKGIVCPSCQGCTRRRDWAFWDCENCGARYQLPQRPVPIADATADGSKVRDSPVKFIFGNAVRSLNPQIVGQYKVYDFVLPDEKGVNIGNIRIYKSNAFINGQVDGPDDLFREIQEADCGLKRNPVRQKGAVGEILTSHWTANWGAPYKFAVAQISKPFSEAPAVVIKSLKRMTWAGERALTDDAVTQEFLSTNPNYAQEAFTPFNEVLSLGYFEKSDIDYHDDGEKELGATVATLSLGCSATMAFRPKGKNLIQGPPQKGNMKGTKKDVLKLTLEHGDIMVMHGREIQKLYDHAVIPHGKVRFALTCRHIRPETLPQGERAYAVSAGQLPLGSERWDYDGDLNAMHIDQDLGDLNATPVVRKTRASKAEPAVRKSRALALASVVQKPTAEELKSELVDQMKTRLQAGEIDEEAATEVIETLQAPQVKDKEE